MAYTYDTQQARMSSSQIAQEEQRRKQQEEEWARQMEEQRRQERVAEQSAQKKAYEEAQQRSAEEKARRQAVQQQNQESGASQRQADIWSNIVEQNHERQAENQKPVNTSGYVPTNLLYSDNFDKITEYNPENTQYDWNGQAREVGIDENGNIYDRPLGISTEQAEWLQTPEGQSALANQNAKRANDQTLKDAANQNLTPEQVNEAVNGTRPITAPKIYDPKEVTKALKDAGVPVDQAKDMNDLYKLYQEYLANQGTAGTEDNEWDNVVDLGSALSGIVPPVSGLQLGINNAMDVVDQYVRGNGNPNRNGQLAIEQITSPVPEQTPYTVMYPATEKTGTQNDTTISPYTPLLSTEDAIRFGIENSMNNADAMREAEIQAQLEREDEADKADFRRQLAEQNAKDKITESAQNEPKTTSNDNGSSGVFGHGGEVARQNAIDEMIYANGGDPYDPAARERIGALIDQIMADDEVDNTERPWNVKGAIENLIDNTEQTEVSDIYADAIALGYEPYTKEYNDYINSRIKKLNDENKSSKKKDITNELDSIMDSNIPTTGSGSSTTSKSNNENRDWAKNPPKTLDEAKDAYLWATGKKLEDLDENDFQEIRKLYKYYTSDAIDLSGGKDSQSGGTTTTPKSKNPKSTTFTPSYGQDMEYGVKAPYKKGGYTAEELKNMGNKPYKDSSGKDQYEGYYYWDGAWYPVDQEKAEYYQRYGTYNGWDEGMRDYYNTFGTFYGYTPTWKQTGRNVRTNSNGGYSGSYSRSYSPSYGYYGGNRYYPSYGSVNPDAVLQEERRINNNMKNWAFNG